MHGNKHKFVRPGDEDLYPTRNKDGETFINPNTDMSVVRDVDSTTNFIYNRYHHLPMDTQRQKLPIFQYKHHILYLLEKYQTLVLVGETGCGKSTQVPQYLNEIGHRVCVTQPRAAAAVTLAQRVASERGSDDVGFAVGAASNKTSDAGIVFMTEGVLLRETLASPLLMQYSCIILDEVHERSEMTDVLMGLIKKIAKKRKHLKLVISSATMDAEFYRDFFNLSGVSGTPTTAVLTARGRPHPVQIFYTQEPVADYVKATVDTVIKIHENQPFGDILAFLTSQKEILSALDLLQTYAEDNNAKNRYRKTFPSGVKASDIVARPLYGSLPLRRQLQAFQAAGANERKVVLATNIAETAVTVPGVVYVIDCGFEKVSYYHPSARGVCVSVRPAGEPQREQRTGRAGRERAGQCYRLYCEGPAPEHKPLHGDLTRPLLHLYALGVHNFMRFPFPVSPPAALILSALESLLALGAVDAAGGNARLTDLGRQICELSLPPTIAKMVCVSGDYGCIDEALSIASMVSVSGVFVRDTAKGAARIARRNNFEVAEGDIIMYLNIMTAYMKVRKRDDDMKAKRQAKQWCQKMYLNPRVMEKALEIRQSLEKIVKYKFQLENKTFEGPDLGSAASQRIMKCVTSGLFPSAARLALDGGYRGIGGARLLIAPDSCLYQQQQPIWVVYAGVECKDAEIYMRDLMVINKDWLIEIAPHYYKET